MKDSDVIIWLERLLYIEFKGKNIIKEQVINSGFKIKEKSGYISVEFTINNQLKKFPFSVRVPIEMRVYQKNHSPIVFFIYIVNGYVNEFEIITADSSQINFSDLDYQKVEYEINKELVISNIN